MLVPSMPLAAARTSSRLLQNLTPPALPRPPAWICALTIHCEPPSALAASTAASGELATLPGGTAMPYCANSSLAWYSWKFIPIPRANGETYRPHAMGGVGAGESSDGGSRRAAGVQCALLGVSRQSIAQYGQAFSRKGARNGMACRFAAVRAGAWHWPLACLYSSERRADAV